HARVFAVNVVTQLGARDRLAHLGRRQRNRVAAQIDQDAMPVARALLPRRIERGEVAAGRIDDLYGVFRGVGEVQLLAVAGQRAARTDMPVDQRQFGYGVGGEIDLANRMIVGVQHVERRSVGAYRAGIVELRFQRGTVLVPFRAGARNRAGLQRREIDLADHVIAGIRDVDGFFVNRDSTRSAEL